MTAWWQFEKKNKLPAHQPRKRVNMPVFDDAYRSQFFSTDVDRYLSGWDTQSHGIDWYLRDELTKIRARARKLRQQDPYGARYVQLLYNNVIGNQGFKLQSQSKRGGKLDTVANEAIEAAFKEWSGLMCDVEGIRTLKDFEDAIVAYGATDGEFLFEEIIDPKVNKFGYALKLIDPELLDVTKNELTLSGGEIRLGVEYNSLGQRIRYWFRERNFNGDYNSGRTYSIDAEKIIHGFIPECANQSRGIPWMTPGLEKAKHLAKFEEAAIVRARATASRVAAIYHENGNPYTKTEEQSADGSTAYDLAAAGEVWDIGSHRIQQLDGDYPSAMYEMFVKQNVKELSIAWGVSYQSLANDLSDTSFASGRTGIMEERETYKTRQEMIGVQFLSRIYKNWLVMAYARGAIVMGRVKAPLKRPVDDYLHFVFQGKRWQWIDPRNDMQANQLAIDLHLKSRSQIIREQGDDPDTVWQTIASDDARMEELGLQPAAPVAVSEEETEGKENAE